MEDSAKVEAICNERDGLREEIAHLENAVFAAVLGFVTVIAAVAGLYYGSDEIIKDPVTRGGVVFALTQLEYFIGLFIMGLTGNMATHAGYIRGLEERMNQLFDEHVSIWESHITRHFLFHPRSSLFWTNLVLLVFVLVVFSASAIYAALQMDQKWLLTVVTVELLSLCFISILTSRQCGLVHEYATRMLGTARDGA